MATAGISTTLWGAQTPQASNNRARPGIAEVVFSALSPSASNDAKDFICKVTWTALSPGIPTSTVTAEIALCKWNAQPNRSGRRTAGISKCTWSALSPTVAEVEVLSTFSPSLGPT